ncbi:MAG: hypothetical protein AAGJ10_16150 [Bacteroidota bacterium]
MTRLIRWLICAPLVLAGCSMSYVDPEPTEASALTLLPDGFTLGTTLYGSADLSWVGESERGLIEAAADSGMGGFTYYVDWADLEPTPGEYTLDEFTETLATLQGLGLRPFVNITVGDIAEYNLPPDLSDGAGGLGDGVSLDDPVLIERFGRILDRVVPIAMAHGVFFLGVGNEIDARLDEEGTTPAELGAYTSFVRAARARVHRMAPDLAVGVVLTTTAIRNRTLTFRSMKQVSDVVPFNYGPIQDTFFVFDLDDVEADFQEVVDAYGEGPLLIQELTCPSAQTMNASEAWQRDCFVELFDVIEATPRVRFASVFTFQDFDDATCQAVRDALLGDELEGLPPAVAQRLADYLCELGVIRPDGTPKPAWAEIVKAAVATRE